MSTFVLVLELVGTVAFAISGALLAAQKRMDIFGVCIMGLVTACGGGVLRDVLLGRLPPVMFRDPKYAIVAIAASAAVFPFPVYRLMAKRARLYDHLMLWADGLGLGVFTAVGVTAAIQQGYGDNLFFTVFMGVMTGVGGGVLRDVMAIQPPFIFVKHIYACASLLGAILCAALWSTLGQTACMLLCCAVVMLIRLLAAHFRWELPTAEHGDPIDPDIFD